MMLQSKEINDEKKSESIIEEVNKIQNIAEYCDVTEVFGLYKIRVKTHYNGKHHIVSDYCKTDEFDVERIANRIYSQEMNFYAKAKSYIGGRRV